MSLQATSLRRPAHKGPLRYVQERAIIGKAPWNGPPFKKVPLRFVYPLKELVTTAQLGSSILLGFLSCGNYLVSYRRSADFEVPGGATSMYTLEVWAFEPGTGQTTSGSSRAVMLDSQKICRANYKMRKVQKAKLFLADELGSTSSIPPPSLGAGDSLNDTTDAITVLEISCGPSDPESKAFLCYRSNGAAFRQSLGTSQRHSKIDMSVTETHSVSVVWLRDFRKSTLRSEVHLNFNVNSRVDHFSTTRCWSAKHNTLVINTGAIVHLVFFKFKPCETIPQPADDDLSEFDFSTVASAHMKPSTIMCLNDGAANDAQAEVDLYLLYGAPSQAQHDPESHIEIEAYKFDAERFVHNTIQTKGYILINFDLRVLKVCEEDDKVMIALTALFRHNETHPPLSAIYRRTYVLQVSLVARSTSIVGVSSPANVGYSLTEGAMDEWGRRWAQTVLLNSEVPVAPAKKPSVFSNRNVLTGTSLAYIIHPYLPLAIVK